MRSALSCADTSHFHVFSAAQRDMARGPLICATCGSRPADGAEGGVAFYNLELADTNVVDHTNWHFAREDGLTFEVEPPDEAAA